MKIIQVMPEFGLGGAEIMCENLTYGLKKYGHTVIVVSLFTYPSAITQRMEDNGIDIYYMNKRSGLDLSMIFKLMKLFRREKPDVIHTHRHVLQYTVPAAVLAGVKRRIHTIHSVASKENNKIGRIFNKISFRICGVIPVALSSTVRDTIVDEYGIDRSEIPIIFNGIDLNNCKEKNDYDIVDQFKILHIGRFADAKNHIGLLEAFSKFHKKHSESALYLIGDGENRNIIEEYISENNLQEHVHLLGQLGNVYEYLHKADMFTLPSLYEGVPMTLIEAMGTGLPIVATRVGGIPDMLDEDSAVLVEGSSDAICEGFEKYYFSKDLRMAHGRAVLKKVDTFSLEAMTEKYLNEYSRKTFAS